MDKIKDIITTTVHNVDENQVYSLLSALVDLGVETVDDLGYVVEDDLKEFLKPIQVRKLIAAFKSSNSRSPKAAVSSHPAREELLQEAYSSAVGNVQNKNSVSPCSSTESDLQDTSSIPETNSRVSRLELLENIVHWDKIPISMATELCSGQTLEPSSRRHIVRLIADDILSVIKRPKRQEINIISQHIVKQYKNLGGTTGDSLGGCGYKSLSNQITNRIDNISRAPPSSSHKPRANDIVTQVKDKYSKFSVGCTAVKQNQCHELNSASYSVIPKVPLSPVEIVTHPRVSSPLVAKSSQESSLDAARLQLLKNVVKWEKMPSSLMEALQSGNALSKEETNEMVTLIVGDILREIKNPKQREVYLIAEHIVNQYKTLQDKIGGSVVGSKHNFLFNQIFRKLEYLKGKPLSNSEQCANNISFSGTRALGSESNVCTNQLPNSSEYETEESVNVVDDQLVELDNILSVDSHELETLVAQTYSEVNTPESLKAKRNLMSELTKSFMTDSHAVENSFAGSNFNLSFPKMSVSSISPKKVTALPQKKFSTAVNKPELPYDTTAATLLELENILDWKKFPISIMTELEHGNVLNLRLRREFVRFLSEEIIRVLPYPRRRELYIIARSCVRQYSSLGDRMGDMIVGSGCDLLHQQLINRFDNKYFRQNGDMPMKPTHLPIQKHAGLRYGCVNWSPKFPTEETVKSVEAKKDVLHKLSKCFVINSSELESLIASTYYCQRRTINSGKTVSTVLSEWPLLFSGTGMMEHFRLLTGINLKDQIKNSLSSKGKQILRYMSTVSNKEVKSCLQDMKTIQKSGNYSKIFALLMLLSSYFIEDITSLIIKHEGDDPSDIGSLKLPRGPCLIAVGTSLLVTDHFMLVCGGIIVNKAIKEDLLALCMLFASYFVLNFQYPKSNKSVLEFIQRCLADINPPSGTKVEGGKDVVNRRVLKLCNHVIGLSWMHNSTPDI